jgi:hypothetical protein
MMLENTILPILQRINLYYYCWFLSFDDALLFPDSSIGVLTSALASASALALALALASAGS